MSSHTASSARESQPPEAPRHHIRDANLPICQWSLPPNHVAPVRRPSAPAGRGYAAPCRMSRANLNPNLPLVSAIKSCCTRPRWRARDAVARGQSVARPSRPAAVPYDGPWRKTSSQNDCAFAGARRPNQSGQQPPSTSSYG